MVDYSTLKNYNIMNKQKLNYLAPEAETLVIRFEENIMSLRGGVNYASQAGGAGGNDVYDDETESF
jgi:hypothetical protein